MLLSFALVVFNMAIVIFVQHSTLNTIFIFSCYIFFFNFSHVSSIFFSFSSLCNFVSPYNVTAKVVIIRCHFLLMMSSFVYITRDDIINKEFLTKLDNMNQN